MKIIKQSIILLIFTGLGTLIKQILPIPIPGSVLGLGCLYIALEIKIVKLDDVETVGTFLKDNMAIMFVPLTVAIMTVFDILKLNLIQLIIVMIVSTTLTMITVGLISNLLNEKEKPL